jgi:3',5'-cyclic-AMP phosphodiesterase
VTTLANRDAVKPKGIPRVSAPVRRLAWATDLHLNFLPKTPFHSFYDLLSETEADAIAVTGDISDYPHLHFHLSRIAQCVSKPLFIVLGNHDRYHGSFAEAEAEVRKVSAAHPHVHRCAGGEIFALSPQTALIGVDGWADGESGFGSRSAVVLNDTRLIADLAALPRAAQWAKMSALAHASAAAIEPAAEAAMSSFREVIALTHVPPMREATWHQGSHSSPDYLPHFCNAPLGEALRQVCARHPASKLTVLCGHTHSSGVHQENNLTVYTGGSTYGSPGIDRVIAIL